MDLSEKDVTYKIAEIARDLADDLSQPNGGLSADGPAIGRWVQEVNKNYSELEHLLAIRKAQLSYKVGWWSNYANIKNEETEADD